jgi:hypothetical protein
MGVGIAGMAGILALPKALLDGVDGDMSDASSRLDKDMLRLFMLRKLEDEKFFRSLVTVGEPDRAPRPSSMSA